MKKNIFAIATIGLISGAIFFNTSCKKDDETKAMPTITFSGADNTVITKDSIKLTGTATDSSLVSFVATIAAEGELKEIAVKEEGQQTSEVKITKFDSKTGHSYKDKFYVKDFGTLKITITVTDNKSQTVSKYITIVRTAVTTPVTEKTGEFWNVNGPACALGAYDLVADQNISGSSSTVSDNARDMKNTDAAGVTFTGKWESKNGTLFYKNNSFAYATATKESIKAAYTPGLNAITAPAVGDIYIVKLRGAENYAVIKIATIDAAATCATTNNPGKITFTYKK